MCVCACVCVCLCAERARKPQPPSKKTEKKIPGRRSAGGGCANGSRPSPRPPPQSCCCRRDAAAVQEETVTKKRPLQKRESYDKRQLRQDTVTKRDSSIIFTLGRRYVTELQLKESISIMQSRYIWFIGIRTLCDSTAIAGTHRSITCWAQSQEYIDQSPAGRRRGKLCRLQPLCNERNWNGVSRCRHTLLILHYAHASPHHTHTQRCTHTHTHTLDTGAGEHEVRSVIDALLDHVLVAGLEYVEDKFAPCVRMQGGRRQGGGRSALGRGAKEEVAGRGG